MVAEEVGNLARMSGTAATEISTLLQASIEKVEKIVSRSRAKISPLVQTGRARVDVGTRVANDCGRALDVVAQNVTEVNQMVGEIARACQEQAIGVQEVTQAMSQLDGVTQQNAAVAHQSAANVGDLHKRSDSLRHMTAQLLELIGGGTVRPQGAATAAPATVSPTSGRLSAVKMATPASPAAVDRRKEQSAA